MSDRSLRSNVASTYFFAGCLIFAACGWGWQRGSTELMLATIASAFILSVASGIVTVLVVQRSNEQSTELSQHTRALADAIAQLAASSRASATGERTPSGVDRRANGARHEAEHVIGG